MNKFIRLTWFHLKLYTTNQYFFWLTTLSSISLTLLQYLVAYQHHDLNNHHIWIIAGIFGLWSSATTATGVIGFQRNQGTLSYLLNTKTGDVISFLSLILPASIFGLLAFPVSFLTAKIVGLSTGNLSVTLIGYILMLWLASFVLDLFIATFFVLSRNAIVYEELITLPILLISGLFGYSENFSIIYQISKWLSPLTVPIGALTDKSISAIDFASYLFTLGLWLVISYVLFKRVLNFAKKQGGYNLI